MVTMVETIPSLPVYDVVVALSDQALELHDEAVQAIRVNHKDTAQIARRLSDALERATDAYRHPSMVSILYFSDEFKLAVYAPYFLPVLLPLFIQLFKEVKLWRRGGPQ
eukprot:TRINITY_DN15576_c0_g1_i3.p1 TRINITY_DN15576_c0_g1~~TRINITY_DN15576_c0_g1_i3.p1  ORF type:complete len:109 (+),score=15.98 TRINITY_DN15576_c0_g1_i3:158-484(+)